MWYASLIWTKRVEAVGSEGFLSGWWSLERVKNWLVSVSVVWI